MNANWYTLLQFDLDETKPIVTRHLDFLLNDAVYNVILEDLNNPQKQKHWIWLISMRIKNPTRLVVTDYWDLENKEQFTELLNNKDWSKRFWNIFLKINKNEKERDYLSQVDRKKWDKFKTELENFGK